MYVDEHLVPAHLLVNGTSIPRVEAARRVNYFHIELDDHDVIFAEGAPAETFLDRDSRRLSQNVADYVDSDTHRDARCSAADEGDKNAFTQKRGYPADMLIDGIPLRGQVWFERDLAGALPRHFA